MKLTLHKENTIDQHAVFNLVKKAFENENFNDNNQQYLVDRLRNSDAFIPELSIVAKNQDKIIGHILLTKVSISNGAKTWVSLALAPITVLPEMQGQGVGELLIKKAHEKAKELGFQSIVLLGHSTYYEKFGYVCADTFGIEFPFDIPKENCLAIELIEGSLKNVRGKVIYPKPFYEMFN